jgi:hypothetical protein
MPALTAPPHCPACCAGDCVEKVSSIYVKEFSRRYYARPWPLGQTRLGALLSPPKKPGAHDAAAHSLFDFSIVLCWLGFFAIICLLGPEALRVFPSDVMLVGMSFGGRAAAIYSAEITAAALVVGSLLATGAVLIGYGARRMRSWS